MTFTVDKFRNDIPHSLDRCVVYWWLDAELSLKYSLVEKYHLKDRGGLIVSALDSGSTGPGLSPGWDTALYSCAKHLIPTVSLSTQVYKWVPVNC